MSTVELSKKIVSATDFLFSIHKDMKSLIRSMVDIMAKKGWRQLWDKNGLSNELGSKFNVNDPVERTKDWVARSLALCFIPNTSTEQRVDRLVACHFNLSPPANAEHDYAVLMVTASRFDTPLPKEEIEKGWRDDPGAQAFKATLEKQGPVRLATDAFEDMFPAASWVIATASPLGSLTDLSALEKFLIPLMEAENQFASVKHPFSGLPRDEVERRLKEAREHPERGKPLADFLANLEKGEVSA